MLIIFRRFVASFVKISWQHVYLRANKENTYKKNYVDRNIDIV